MKFSILVPVYNVEKYLTQCIESVLNQTYPCYELILVDDGSTDSSGAICDEYAEKYEFIKVIHKPNGGLLHTRRIGLQHATGDWYVFLDSDDYLQTDALQTIYETVQKYDCDCVVYKWQRVFEGKIIDASSSFDPVPDKIIEDKRTLYKLVFSDSAYNSLCKKACKATLFDCRDYSEYYGVRHAEDLLQSLEILENARKVVLIDKILYNYTQNSNSIMHDLKLDNYEMILVPIEKAMQLVERESAFSSSDFSDVYTARMISFVSMIVRICCSKNKTKDKVALFKRMESCDFYRRLKGAYKDKMLGKCKQRFLFGFYTKGFYRTYIWTVQLYASFCRLIKR